MAKNQLVKYSQENFFQRLKSGIALSFRVLKRDVRIIKLVTSKQKKKNLYLPELPNRYDPTQKFYQRIILANEKTSSPSKLAFAMHLFGFLSFFLDQDKDKQNNQLELFIKYLNLGLYSSRKVKELIHLAQDSGLSFEYYCHKLVHYSGSKRLLGESVFMASKLALIHRKVYQHNIEQIFVKTIEIFQLDESVLNESLQFNIINSEIDPYKFLGVSKGVDNKHLTETYKRLAKESHPDQFLPQEYPQRMIDIYSAKFDRIKNAYNIIKSIS